MRRDVRNRRRRREEPEEAEQVRPLEGHLLVNALLDDISELQKMGPAERRKYSGGD